MAPPSLEVQAATAVYSPPRPPADRRLTDVRRNDQAYAVPAFDTPEAWERRKAALREQILCAAGLWPEPPRTPLQPQVGPRHAYDGFTVQTVALQSRPGFYLTGNLYRPLEQTGKRPGLLNPHGHSRNGRLEHSANNSTIARCISFARQGYVAFAYDMVGYNDARQIPHPFGDARDWLWGLGALGLQLWNSVRALDFLLSLPDVDPERAGCVGESGGATQTFLLAAIDERVRYLAPVVMVSAHYQGGCACENAPGLRLDTNNVEIAAMAAPRSMTLVSATGDWTRNTPEVEYPAIRRIYALYGAEDRLSQAQIEAPHNFNQSSREAVYRFFAHWFQGTPLEQPVTEAALTPPPAEVLLVFPGSLPSDALDSAGLRQATRRANEVQLAAALPRDAAGLERFRAGYGIAYRQAFGMATDEAHRPSVDRLNAVSFGSREATRLLIAYGAGERIPALFFAGADGKRPVVLLHPFGKAAFFEERGGAVEAGQLLEGLLAAGRPVLLLDAFLTGDYQTPYALAGRDQASPHFLTFNSSDTALRVRDVCAAVGAAKQLAATGDADLAGLEEAGIWCLLARPLIAGVHQLVASLGGFDPDDDEAYLYRLYVPGLRRAGGLLTAALLAAPEPAYLFDAQPRPSLDAADALYRSLGASDALTIQAGRASPPAILARLLAR